MYEGQSVAAVLLMGGEGKRFGGNLPKQFHLLNEKMIYQYPLETIERLGIFDEIVLVCHPDWMDGMRQVRVVRGGKTRQESSYQGVLATSSDIVLIHDAVRPFVSARILKENVEMAIAHGAVNTCIPSVDTLVFAPDGNRLSAIPNRAEYLRGQTPQTFRRDWILQAHEQAIEKGIENATDDCRLVFEMGREVRVVKGEERNMKITSDYDLALASALIVTDLQYTRQQDRAQSQAISLRS